jgi:hypothetical protein
VDSSTTHIPIGLHSSLLLKGTHLSVPSSQGSQHVGRVTDIPEHNTSAINYVVHNKVQNCSKRLFLCGPCRINVKQAISSPNILFISIVPIIYNFTKFVNTTVTL